MIASASAERPTIALVCTVRDEAATIGALLDSILAQSLPPDEIVINDCQSRDQTAAIVQAYAVREPRIRLVRGGHNISSGRNNAIRHASSAIIASTDAGLRLPPTWLDALVEPMLRNEADLVGGFYLPDPQSPFELSLAWTNYRRREEVDPATFPVFGNCVAFRRELWERVGGFAEWLDHSEDLLFTRAAEAAGYRRAFTAEAQVIFRPRSSLGQFMRQYYNYARGDGMANLWPRRHLLRYAVYGAGLSGGLFALKWPWARPFFVFALLLGAIGYCRKPYWRLGPHLPNYRWPARLIILGWVPLIRLSGDLAKMLGYAVGRRIRAQRRLPPR